MKECSFRNNSANSGDGGSIYIEDSELFEFNDSSLKDSFSMKKGGGLFIYNVF